MTQLMFKGYEEARVALTTLLFTVPCCVIVGVEYGVFNSGTLIKVGAGEGVIFLPVPRHELSGSHFVTTPFHLITTPTPNHHQHHHQHHPPGRPRHQHPIGLPRPAVRRALLLGNQLGRQAAEVSGGRCNGSRCRLATLTSE